MKILKDDAENKYTKAIKEVEECMNKNKVSFEAQGGWVFVTIDDKEFRLKDVESGEQVTGFPRILILKNWLLKIRGGTMCKKCGSERVAKVSGKCSDMCGVRLGERELEGYVPSDMGIGGGDYLEFSYCLDCGQLQGNFPIEETVLESE